jgi:hypothetical protein
MILAGLVLLSGCSNLFSPPGQPQQNGGLTISVADGDAGARTLYPGTPVFTKYVLSFSSGHADVTISSGTTTVIEDLDPGAYTVTAKGYVMLNEVETEAASGTGTINYPNDKTLSITISAKDTGSNGLFKYSVVFPAAKVDTATMKLVKFAGGGTPAGFPVNLKSEPASGQVALAPGYYLLTIELRNKYQQAGHTDIVHIYSGMETELPAYTFAESDFVDFIKLSGTLTVTGDKPYQHINVIVRRDNNYLSQSQGLSPPGSIFDWEIYIAQYSPGVNLTFEAEVFYSGSSKSDIPLSFTPPPNGTADVSGIGLTVNVGNAGSGGDNPLQDTVWEWTDGADTVILAFLNATTFTGIHPDGPFGGTYSLVDGAITLIISPPPPEPNPSTWNGAVSGSTMTFTNSLVFNKTRGLVISGFDTPGYVRVYGRIDGNELIRTDGRIHVTTTGAVFLPLINTGGGTPYTGNGTFSIDVRVYTSPGGGVEDRIAYKDFGTVQFTNGNAKIEWGDGDNGEGGGSSITGRITTPLLSINGMWGQLGLTEATSYAGIPDQGPEYGGGIIEADGSFSIDVNPGAPGTAYLLLLVGSPDQSGAAEGSILVDIYKTPNKISTTQNVGDLALTDLTLLETMEMGGGSGGGGDSGGIQVYLEGNGPYYGNGRLVIDSYDPISVGIITNGILALDFTVEVTDLEDIGYGMTTTTEGVKIYFDPGFIFVQKLPEAPDVPASYEYKGSIYQQKIEGTTTYEKFYLYSIKACTITGTANWGTVCDSLQIEVGWNAIYWVQDSSLGTNKYTTDPAGIPSDIPWLLRLRN